jgi:P4 family phage/plasmid primase-like protien
MTDFDADVNPESMIAGKSPPKRLRAIDTTHPPLLPQHLEDLHRSGLTEMTVKAAGLFSLTDPVEVGKCLGWRGPARQLGPCLAFPYYGQDGAASGYVRLKPDRPRTEEGGRIVKYESPKKQPNRLYVPLGTRTVLDDADKPLLITEGEKKALAADQHGFPCLGLVGVYGWQQGRPKGDDGKAQGQRQCLPDLATVALQGRLVHIVFDSDAATNPKVTWAEWHLAQALKGRGADVRVARLPPGPIGSDQQPKKVGLDDYLVANGPESFRALLAVAKPPQRPSSDAAPLDDDAGVFDRPNNPHRLARLWLAKEATFKHRGDRAAYFRQQYWIWDGNRWQVVPDADVKARFASFIRGQLKTDLRGQNVPIPAVTAGLVSNTLLAIGGETLIPLETPQPSWRGENPGPQNWIAMRNGILDVDAIMDGKDDVLRPHSPLWFSPTCLPFPFDPKARCPVWTAFLKRNMGDDPAKAALLQQWAGYSLLPDTSLQRFLLMVGEGSNGKSVVCAVVVALLGEDNVSSVPLELFADKFRLVGTLGKLVNVVAEVGELDRIAEGQLKAFVSGDPLEFEQKFKTPFTARPTARLMLATNNPPTFADKSDGIWRRVLLLPFNVQIPEQERIAGMDKPEYWRSRGELPGILNWALIGLTHLRKQGRFTVPENCRKAAEKLRVDVNPAKRFLTERYQQGKGDVAKGTLYAEYRHWCEDNGHQPLASIGFGKEVFRTFPGIKEGKVRVIEGRKDGYVGLAVKEASGAGNES